MLANVPLLASSCALLWQSPQFLLANVPLLASSCALLWQSPQFLLANVPLLASSCVLLWQSPPSIWWLTSPCKFHWAMYTCLLIRTAVAISPVLVGKRPLARCILPMCNFLLIPTVASGNLPPLVGWLTSPYNLLAKVQLFVDSHCCLLKAG